MNIFNKITNVLSDNRTIQHDAPAKVSPGLECPVCGSNAFRVYNGRENAQCDDCKSLERSRLLWMVLERSGALKPNMRVLHVAPELCFMREFSKRYGECYHACDFEPARYKNKECRVFKIDLCRDAAIMPTGVFDLIIHNHVLEHLPCEVGAVIEELNRLVAPGGKHFFSVPFRGARTREDLSPDMSPEERTRQFAQADHMRLFGTVEFPNFLAERFNGEVKLFNISKLLDDASLQKANIPADTLNKISGHSIFYFEKALP